MASPNPFSDPSSPLHYGESSPRSEVPKTPTSDLRSELARNAPLTPSSHRGELEGNHRRPHFLGRGMDPDQGGLTSEVETHVVWGTTVDVNDCMERFRAFFQGFIDENTGEPKYPELLSEIALSNSHNINLDCQNLREFDDLLYRQLVLYPQEIIPAFDIVINELLTSMLPGPEEDDDESTVSRHVQVRTFNLDELTSLRSLDPEHLDQMITLKGMVIRVGSNVPDLRTAFFRCHTCSNEESVNCDRGRIQQPIRCPRCNSKDTLQIIHNRCEFADKQLLRVQESPESIPDGETPQTMDVFAFDDLVDVAKPGDRVMVTGIFRAIPVRINSKRRTVRAVYKTYIDTIHINKTDPSRFGVEEDGSGESFEETDVVRQVVEERHVKLRELSEREDIYELLTASIAPSIWGHEDIKKGILCQLFGGTNKSFSESGSGRFRGEINVLLCGDPGTSKSQMLQYVHKIAPRGIFTSGKGSSAVGLTAYVTKDPETKEFVMESGALVLSDNGICCIDEFDKMSDTTRSILHEVMEQQTVSIAKAGIIATLNARTSVLAAANPMHSRYDTKLSVVDNIRLPPTLLSRFDLIYLVLDKVTEPNDRRLSKHLVAMYYEDLESVDFGEVVKTEILTQYISFARKNIHPRLSDEAAAELQNGYIKMRKLGQTQSRGVITATPRQLESLIRLSEALAKMRFSDVVQRSHVIEAIRLMDVSTGKSATDPVTGIVDIDQFTTGLTNTARREIAQQSEALRTIILAMKSPTIRFHRLLSEFNESSQLTLQKPEFWRVVNSLADAGVIRVSQRQSGDDPEIRRLI